MASTATQPTVTEVLKPLLTASISMIVLTTLFFCLRYVSRIFVKKVKLGRDDIALLCAYICDMFICSIGLSKRTEIEDGSRYLTVH